MEKVFDLREFLLTIYEKGKKSIIWIIALGMIGTIYGGITNNNNIYISQSSASINLTPYEVLENDGLDIVMGNIRETISSNYFYIAILNEINSTYTTEEIQDFFNKDTTPNLNDLKSVVNLYTSGNTVLVEVKADNSVIAKKFSNSIRETTAKKLAQNIQNITITIQDQYVYNQMLETGDTLTPRIVKYSLVGIGAGIVLSILYAFFFNVIDTKVKSVADLEKYNLPIFGEITEGEDIDD